ncbi:hypothetical protein BA190_09480 [Labrys sp. WJW]|uniref:hypothetical protein n=1 Tax=Labrys sp. WJW TaxID=1737983 RepID=UPI000832B5C7|nr:hypothetical protein [Labrys sp. WJW]OCC05137.1 hypothetical protein BA190_09480 [Labrys sp. WJW]
MEVHQMGKPREPDLYEIATQIAVDAGAIERDDERDGRTIDNFDDEAAEEARKVGAQMVDDGEVDCTHEEMRRAIDDVIADAASE